MIKFESKHLIRRAKGVKEETGQESHSFFNQEMAALKFLKDGLITKR